jgi:hypothetical protein
MVKATCRLCFLQQSKKATKLILKIKYLRNLVLQGVAHNLVLSANYGHLQIQLAHSFDLNFFIDIWMRNFYFRA